MTARGAALVIIMLGGTLVACGRGCPKPTADAGGSSVRPAGIPAVDTSRLEPQVAEKIAAAEEGVRTRPNGPAWLHLGRVLLAHSKWLAAEQALVAGADAAADPSVRGECLYLAGRASQLGGEPPDHALSHLTRAIALRDAYAPARLYAGQAELSRGRLDEAERHFRRALQLERTSHALLGLGEVALRRGDPAGAVTWLEEAHRLAPRHVEVTATLSHALAAAGRREESLARAREVPPRHARTFVRDPLMLRAMAETVSFIGLHEQADRALGAGYPRDALAFLSRALAVYPDSAETHVERARILSGIGEHESAVAECRRALSIDPQLGVARTLEGLCLAALGRTGDAEAALRDGVRIAPTSTETRHFLAAFLTKRGATCEAREILEGILREAPGDVTSRLLLARVLETEGDALGALRQAERALREAPWSDEARELAARLRR